MRERKPAWTELPPALRLLIEERARSRIARTQRVYGGYGPSVTLRVVTQAGARLFLKGAGPDSNDVNWASVPFEQRLYESGAVSGIAPRYLGSVEYPGWHLLLLQDLGHRGRVPPWTDARARAVLAAMARFHATVPPLLDLAPVSPELGGNWARIRSDRAVRQAFLALADDPDLGGSWLSRALPALERAEADALSPVYPAGFLHTDIRSDNLRVVDGRLVLFDWANAARGSLILDPVFFLPSLVQESGLDPAVMAAHYRECLASYGIAIPEAALTAAASLTAGYLAARAGLPVPPDLPRLRIVQRAQLGPALAFAAARLQLPAAPFSRGPRHH
jgi:hypothetical protein